MHIFLFYTYVYRENVRKKSIQTSSDTPHHIFSFFYKYIYEKSIHKWIKMKSTPFYFIIFLMAPFSYAQKLIKTRTLVHLTHFKKKILYFDLTNVCVFWYGFDKVLRTHIRGLKTILYEFIHVFDQLIRNVIKLCVCVNVVDTSSFSYW